MDGWLAEKIQAREQQQRHAEIIKAETGAIWKGLTASVFESVKQYRERYPENAPPYDRVITNPEVYVHNEFRITVVDFRDMPMATPSRRHSVTVKLDRDRCAISTDSGTLFEVGVGQNSQACLLVDGNEIMLEGATQRILAPVLFPDLK